MPRIIESMTRVEIKNWNPNNPVGFKNESWIVRAWINETDWGWNEQERRVQLSQACNPGSKVKWDSKKELVEQAFKFLEFHGITVNAIEVIDTYLGSGAVFYPDWP